jgi:hypothetical protein
MNTKPKQFLVSFLIPQATLAQWETVDPVVREKSERQMMLDWAAWCEQHAAMIVSTQVAGKTKQVINQHVSDIRNDIVVFAVMQGESHDQVAQILSAHPHLQIPNSSIDVMEAKSMSAHS